MFCLPKTAWPPTWVGERSDTPSSFGQPAGRRDEDGNLEGAWQPRERPGRFPGSLTLWSTGKETQNGCLSPSTWEEDCLRSEIRGGEGPREGETQESQGAAGRRNPERISPNRQRDQTPEARSRCSARNGAPDRARGGLPPLRSTPGSPIAGGEVRSKDSDDLCQVKLCRENPVSAPG